MLHTSKFLPLIIAIMGLETSVVHADIILSSTFDGVVKTDATAPFTATGITWDSVNGIVTPAGELTFTDPTAGDVDGFHNVTANEIDVDYNMVSDGPWWTSFSLKLDARTSAIDLTSIDFNARITGNTGGSNTTASKNGQWTAELFDGSNASLGSVSTGLIGYGTTPYFRSLDLNGLPSLTSSATYSLTLRIDGTGFGHNMSLQDVTINGGITLVPEPSALALLGVGSLLLGRRLRRSILA